MKTYTLLFNCEEELSDKDLYYLIPENILDSILCVRNEDGESILLKGEVEVHMHNTDKHSSSHKVSDRVIAPSNFAI